MVDLARPTDASLERLLGPAVALEGLQVEQIASVFGEGHAAFVAAKFDGVDEAFIAEVAKGIVVGVEILLGHHSEGADEHCFKPCTLSFRAGQVLTTISQRRIEQRWL